MRLFTLLALAALARTPRPPPAPDCPPLAPPAPAEPALPADPLGPLDHEALPLWTNPYARSRAEQGPYLNISEVMKAEGLDRAAAVSVQHLLRAALHERPEDELVSAYQAAVSAVRAGANPMRLDTAALAAAPLIVVFDLDETLLDQRYPATLAPACHTLNYDGEPYVRGDGERWVQLAPGWQQAFEAVRAAHGSIVLFSANVDERVEGILQHWTWEGKPITEHPDIDGILSNSELIVQSKEEAKRTVLEPSKDLRILDSSMTRVILIDDNPTRTFQPANLRLVHKFQADIVCDPAAAREVKDALNNELRTVTAEVSEAAAWMSAQGRSFQEAFAPYTQTGRLAVDAVLAAKKGDRKAAIALVRAHPELIDAGF